MTAWIHMLSDAEATGEAKAALEAARSPHGTVDNVMRIHSLRPKTMHGHVSLYRSVLHSNDNSLPIWFLETAGTYTSILNNCDYSVAHHSSNLRKLVDNEERYTQIISALKTNEPGKIFQGKELAMLRYVERLTVAVGDIVKSDVDSLRDAGCDDGEILELNQVVGYFCYANRLLNGLGVTTKGDVIGYY